MGISGLLPMLGSVTEEVDIERFRGQRLGVDANGWLHRSLSTCAAELSEGKATSKYVDYCMSLVDVMRGCGAEPVLVFDGAPVPHKALTVEQRRDGRLAAKRAVDALRAAGDRTSHTLVRKAVGVTSDMVRRLVLRLRTAGVAFVVAPYEADAQLAHMARTGAVAAVVSEDSDLLAYGAPHVLFKLERTGTAQLVSLANLQFAEDKGRHLFSGTWPGEWRAWREGLFVDLCILAGCDYLAALPGVGLRTAHGLLRTHRSAETAVRSRVDGPEADLYLRGVAVARDIFHHQMVWDGAAVRPLEALAPGVDPADLPHIGQHLPPALGRRICADAAVDPRTFADYDEDDDEEEAAWARDAAGGPAPAEEQADDLGPAHAVALAYAQAVAVPRATLDVMDSILKRPRVRL